MNLDTDPRVGKAGKYRYCKRCGYGFKKPLDATVHFGDKKPKSKQGREMFRHHCSGIPTGHPHENPAPGCKRADLYDQESGKYLPDVVG